MKFTKMSIFLLPFILICYSPLLAMAMKKKGQARPARTKKIEQKIVEQQPKQEMDKIRQNLEESTKTAAKLITDATVAKNDLRRDAAVGTISEDEAAKKIAVFDKVIAKAKRDLLAKAEKAVAVADEKEKEQSYLSRFMTGAYNVGSDVVARFRAGYGYSDQEKSLAQAVIDELQARKKIEKDPQVMKILDDEIYQQQLITGAQMSTEKKLLLGAIGAAALLAGASYFGAAGDEPITGSAEGSPEIAPVVETVQVPAMVASESVILPPNMPVVEPVLQEIVPPVVPTVVEPGIDFEWPDPNPEVTEPQQEEQKPSIWDRWFGTSTPASDIPVQEPEKQKEELPLPPVATEEVVTQEDEPESPSFAKKAAQIVGGISVLGAAAGAKYAGLLGGKGGASGSNPIQHSSSIADLAQQAQQALDAAQQAQQAAQQAQQSASQDPSAAQAARDAEDEVTQAQKVADDAAAQAQRAADALATAQKAADDAAAAQQAAQQAAQATQPPIAPQNQPAAPVVPDSTQQSQVPAGQQAGGQNQS